MIDSDILTIGYDLGADCDTPTLVVGRRKATLSIEIINHICGQEAKDLYNKLIGKETGKVEILSADEIFEVWKKRYLDESDPVMNYRAHETLPNAITVELHSGFEWLFQADENGGHVLNNCGADIS